VNQRQQQAISIRDAGAEDLCAINDIYNYYVVHCTCTYQEEPDTALDREAWFKEHGSRCPVIVAERYGEIVGWGALSAYGGARGRNAYRFTTEDSVYVRHEVQRLGVGKAILEELIRRARDLGYRSMVASISADRTASISLHEKLGFTKIGHFREVGIKFNTWLDVVYYQKRL
jgi:L-amino acid N-acyltransferase